MEEIPESVAELFDDANGDLAVGDLPSAIEKYRKCTEIEPAFFDGWHALGMALMKNGHYPEAIEAGNKAVDLRPNDQLAWSSLSLFYVRNHQIKEAEAASGKARILSWGGKVVRDSDKPGSLGARRCRVRYLAPAKDHQWNLLTFTEAGTHPRRYKFPSTPAPLLAPRF